MKTRHIHPIHDKMINRRVRERILGQRGGVYWMTGLSGSGKSTIAIGLEKELLARGFHAVVLDGDNIRNGINADLTFTVEDRKENIRRIAEITKLFCHTGYITISSFISPTNEMRAFAQSIIGVDDFHEIFVNTPLEICEQRDVKGLYKKARAGEIKNFTGIDSPYETPANPYLEIKTEGLSIEESVRLVLENIIENSKVSIDHEL
jgi:adenylylsulfate kinase